MINVTNSKKSKKNTKTCHKDKKLKVVRALWGPPRRNRVKQLPVLTFLQEDLMAYSA